MKIISKSRTFEPCPEYTGPAVCVDVTPLKKQVTRFGEREVLKIVFEVDALREDGGRHWVWSANFTPSLNDQANLRKFLQQWFGRDLTRAELKGFDMETLIGHSVHLAVRHEQKDGEVFAVIHECKPDTSDIPLQPSGKYIRVKDRQPAAGLAYRRTQLPANPANANGNMNTEGQEQGQEKAQEQARAKAAAAEHEAVKVHAGLYKGIEMRELNIEAVAALCADWLPQAKLDPKPTADDKRLIAALEWWLAEQRAPVAA
jgi:hypothetical protein